MNFKNGRLAEFGNATVLKTDVKVILARVQILHLPQWKMEGKTDRRAVPVC